MRRSTEYCGYAVDRPSPELAAWIPCFLVMQLLEHSFPLMQGDLIIKSAFLLPSFHGVVSTLTAGPIASQAVEWWAERGEGGRTSQDVSKASWVGVRWSEGD